MFSYINKGRLISVVCAFSMMFTANVLASAELSEEAEIITETEQQEESVNHSLVEQLRYTLGHGEAVLEEIHSFKNINVSNFSRNRNEVFTSQLYLNDENLSVYLSQWKNNDSKPEKIEIKESDGYYLINLFNNIEGNDVGYAELTLQRSNSEDEKPVTYVFRQVLEEGMGQHPFIQDIILTPDNTNHCEEYHGKLIAVDDKFEDTLNLGYGFLATRTNYIVYVPWSVNSLEISAEKLNVPDDKTKVTINGTSGENYREITVPLEGDETVAEVIGIAENGKEVVYTIKVIREKQPMATVFTNYFRQYPIYVVSETGKVYYPSEYEQNKVKFYLPLDRVYTYYYTVTENGDYVKTFKLQSAVLKNATIKLPFPEEKSSSYYLD